MTSISVHGDIRRCALRRTVLTARRTGRFNWRNHLHCPYPQPSLVLPEVSSEDAGSAQMVDIISKSRLTQYQRRFSSRHVVKGGSLVFIQKYCARRHRCRAFVLSNTIYQVGKISSMSESSIDITRADCANRCVACIACTGLHYSIRAM